MKAFKCDVCDNYFIQYSDSRIDKIAGYTKNAENFEAIVSIEFIDSHFTEEGKRWDLCPECQNKLNQIVLHFIRQRRPNNTMDLNTDWK